MLLRTRSLGSKTHSGRRRRDIQSLNSSPNFSANALSRVKKSSIGFSMRRCRMGCRFHCLIHKLICTSDGRSPKEQIQQILAVAPVLPRQLMSQSGGGGPASRHQSGGAQAPPQRLQQPTYERQELSNAEAPAHQGSIPLRDAAAPVVRRRDSYSHEVDKFVDAKPA